MKQWAGIIIKANDRTMTPSSFPWAIFRLPEVPLLIQNEVQPRPPEGVRIVLQREGNEEGRPSMYQ